MQSNILTLKVMLHLLEIPTDYWARFINIDTTTDTESQKVSGYSFFGKFSSWFTLNKYVVNRLFLSPLGTPNARVTNNTLRKERKFFATPPYNTASRR